jgi:hypothetical protein
MHEFVDTPVAETCGSEVLDLRTTRVLRGADQSYSLLDMETHSGAISRPSYIGTVRPESFTPLESALGRVNMFSNIPSELSSSADIAGKAVVEKHSSVCVQVGTVVVNDGLPGQVSDRAVSDLKGSGAYLYRV